MGAFIRYRREMQSSVVTIAGVEFAGTLRDFVRGDLARKYPELMADVKVPQLKLNLWYLQMPLRLGFADLSHHITCLDSITKNPTQLILALHAASLSMCGSTMATCGLGRSNDGLQAWCATHLKD